jgi:hypothetical protein
MMKELTQHLEAVGLHPVIIDEDTKFPTLSPFLPGTWIQYAWDSTSLGYLKQCPRLYQYSMIEGWESRRESVHLRFGIEYHQSLNDYQLHRASGLKHEPALMETIHDLLIRTFDWDPDDKLKNKDFLLRTVIWYLDEHQRDSAETVILASGKPAVEQSFRFELDFGPSIEGQPYDQNYVLCGHLDRVVTYSNETFILDYKTSAKTPTDYWFNQWEPNNQMSLYTLAGKIVLGKPIHGVIIDAAQIAVGFSRFVRGVTYRTADQLDEWLRDLRHWLRLAEGYATEGYWPQNDTACDKYGGCRFREICNKSPNVRGGFLKGNFNKLSEEERWNPLRTR